MRIVARWIKESEMRSLDVDHIVLVHGTWGKRSRWIQEDSTMHRLLGKAFENATISSFIWSGSNSHLGRTRAALELTAYLNTLTELSVDVVAHSHGGNVALAPARLARPCPRPRCLIMLSTPFVVLGRKVDTPLRFALSFAVGCVLLIPLTILGMVPPSIAWPAWSVATLTAVASLYSSLALQWIVRRSETRSVASAMLGYSDKDLPEPIRGAGQWRENVAWRREIVSIPNDEAGGALGMSQFLGMLSGLAVRLLNLLSAGMAMAFGVVVYVSVIASIVVLILAVLAVLTLVLIASGWDLSAAIDRVSAMGHAEWSFSSNPIYGLVDEVVPRARDNIGAALAVASQVLWVVLIVVRLLIIAVMTGFAVLFGMILLQSLALGHDGALLQWGSPLTTASTPLGTQRASLLVLPQRGLAHSSLTSDSQAIRQVITLITRGRHPGNLDLTS